MLVVHVGEPCFAGVHGQVGDGFFGFEKGVDFLFEGAFGDKAVDLYIALLTDTEGAVGGLGFDGGVPPQIVMDDLRGGDEVAFVCNRRGRNACGGRVPLRWWILAGGPFRQIA